MRKIWSNVDVDLKLLTSAIQDFFEKKGFLTAVESSSCGFVIKAEASDVYDINGGVLVSVNGGSDSLIVSFIFDKEGDVVFSPLMLSFFGGGLYFIRKLKSDEKRVLLEREFWRFIDDVLPRVSRSH
ncbi:MAG: hypothetical protein QXR45_09895 [Candidatus Bathyarchaeia archaeon]